MIKLAYVIVVLASLSFTANAACDGFTCSGKMSSFAESLKVTPDDWMITLTRNVDAKALSCELIDHKYIGIPTSSKNADAIYSLLLTAFAANAQVSLTLSSTDKQCKISTVELMPTN